MRKRNGEEITPRISNDGKPVMIPRIIYMGPGLWDMADRLASARGITRSMYIRAAFKKQHEKCGKIGGVDWSEVAYI